MTRSPTPTALERLKAQRDKLNARIQDGEARDKARERRQQRQRQILVGTFILEQAHRDGDYAKLVMKLEGYLTRDNDRKLFDLPVQGIQRQAIQGTGDDTHPKTERLVTAVTSTATDEAA